MQLLVKRTSNLICGQTVGFQCHGVAQKIFRTFDNSFKKKFNGTNFPHHFCIKTGVKGPEEFMLYYVFPSTRSLLGSSTANRPQTTNKSPEMDILKYPQNITDRFPNDTSKKNPQLPSQQNLKQTRGIPKYHRVIWPHHLQFYKFITCAMSPY